MNKLEELKAVLAKHGHELIIGQQGIEICPIGESQSKSFFNKLEELTKTEQYLKITEARKQAYEAYNKANQDFNDQYIELRKPVFAEFNTQPALEALQTFLKEENSVIQLKPVQKNEIVIMKLQTQQLLQSPNISTILDSVAEFAGKELAEKMLKKTDNNQKTPNENSSKENS